MMDDHDWTVKILGLGGLGLAAWLIASALVTLAIARWMKIQEQLDDRDRRARR